MVTQTANYSFNLPSVGGDKNAWGDFLNDNWSSLDTILTAFPQYTVDETIAASWTFTKTLKVSPTAASVKMIELRHVGSTGPAEYAHLIDGRLAFKTTTDLAGGTSSAYIVDRNDTYDAMSGLGLLKKETVDTVFAKLAADNDFVGDQTVQGDVILQGADALPRTLELQRGVTGNYKLSIQSNGELSITSQDTPVYKLGRTEATDPASDNSRTVMNRSRADDRYIQKTQLNGQVNYAAGHFEPADPTNASNLRLYGCSLGTKAGNSVPVVLDTPLANDNYAVLIGYELGSTYVEAAVVWVDQTTKTSSGFTLRWRGITQPTLEPERINFSVVYP